MVGSADILVRALQESSSKSRVLFTCRPLVHYNTAAILSLRLEGFELGAAQSLFSKRGASAIPGEIEAAHDLTKGHVFWLDLLAVQVAQRTPGPGLSSLLLRLRPGA